MSTSQSSAPVITVRGNATEAGFIQRIKAEVAIISTGDNQQPNFKHPRCATYKSLADGGVGVVLQTELGKTDCTGAPPIQPVVVNGTIRIDVSGKSYGISSYGTKSPANGGDTTHVTYACDLTGCKEAIEEPEDDNTTCCRVCTNSQACGDACIPLSASCTKPPGCACSGD